jgi:hypothetical protein
MGSRSAASSRTDAALRWAVPKTSGLAGVLGVVAAFLGAPVQADERHVPHECRYDVVAPDEGERRAAFVAWLAVHSDVLGDAASLLNEPGHPFEVLIADVDNDGHDEYVLASRYGSENLLSMRVFRPTATGWTLVAPMPLNGALAGAREYRGPRLDSSHLLVRFCGRIYVNLLGGQVPNYFPDSWVWEGDGIHRACDTPWLARQRREFQSFFDRQLYDEAHVLLDGLQGRCAALADPALWLAMQSDLAATAYRMRSYRTCLAHVAAAETSAAFASAAVDVKKALAANAALCEAARKRGVAGDPAYDFSWLPKAPPRTQIVFDNRFDGLLSAVVPEAALADGQPLRDALKLSLWLAEAPALVGGRYLFLAGCEPHSCGNRGFVWIDTERRQAIFAAGNTLGSTTVKAAQIPAAFWRQAPFAPGTHLRYVQPDGDAVEIEAPARD